MYNTLLTKLKLKVIRAAWTHSDENLRKDAMKGLNCCGFDRDDFNEFNREAFCESEDIPLPPANPTSNSYEFCQNKVCMNYPALWAQIFFCH